MAYGYSVKAGENEAKAVGLALPISFKHSVEVCRHIKGKPLAVARKALEGAIALKTAIPYRRYNKEMAHHSGVGPGRFPVKVCEAISKVLDSAEANAQLKGMSTANLVIKNVSANKAGVVHHYGRWGRHARRAHIEVVLAVGEPKAARLSGKARAEARMRKAHSRKESPKGSPGARA
jgi:large subunit ribosomal protein L22